MSLGTCSIQISLTFDISIPVLGRLKFSAPSEVTAASARLYQPARKSVGFFLIRPPRSSINPATKKYQDYTTPYAGLQVIRSDGETQSQQRFGLYRWHIADPIRFKSDLKVLMPKAGSKIGGSNIEVKWDAYPDAAYYKMSIYADLSSGAQTNYDYINKRVDGLSYVLDKPLAPGSYTCKVEAYNSNDRKLAESSDDIKFTVTGGAAK